jgi:co-chaperonin GroES (HSP10)
MAVNITPLHDRALVRRLEEMLTTEVLIADAKGEENMAAAAGAGHGGGRGSLRRPGSKTK